MQVVAAVHHIMALAASAEQVAAAEAIMVVEAESEDLEAQI
jgi:hypothetical protein